MKSILQSSWKTMAVCLLALFLQACVQQQTISKPQTSDVTGDVPKTGDQTSAAYASIQRDDGLVAAFGCKNNYVTTRKNGLEALRNRPGDTHYIEFRVRITPAIPTGHMHVVYGELDEKMVPKTFNYVGLLPKGSVFGLYTGIFIPVGISGQLEPSALDCAVKPARAFRMSISAEAYGRLLDRIARFRAAPPDWRMLSYNCNHFAAALGQVVGLKPVRGVRANQFLSLLYFDWYLDANGIKSSARS